MKNSISIRIFLLILTLTTTWAADTSTTGSTSSIPATSSVSVQTDTKPTSTPLDTSLPTSSSSQSSSPSPPPPPPPQTSQPPSPSSQVSSLTQAQAQTQTSDSAQATQQTTLASSTVAPSTRTSIVISSSTTSLTSSSVESIVFITSTAAPSLIPTPCIVNPNDSTQLICADNSSYCDTKNGNICQPKQDNGLSCTSGAQCRSGTCLSNVCSDNQGASSSGDSSSDAASTGIKVGIVSGVVVGILCLVGLAFCVFNRLKTRRRSRFSRPNSYYSPSSEMEETLEYPFAGRTAGFSNATAPSGFSNTTGPSGHQRMGSMGDPTQRINQTPLPVAYATTKTHRGNASQPSLTHMSFLPSASQNNPNKIRNWDYSNDRYPIVGEPQQDQNNRVSTVSTGSKLGRYNYLTKAFSNMRASYASYASRDTNAMAIPYTSSEFQQQTAFDAPPSPAYNRESVNVVYRVANPEQEKDFRKNLAQAAKAIEKPVHSTSASLNTKAPSVYGEDDAGHLTTDPIHLGVGVDSLLQSADYSSSSGNGRYKMSSMYSTYSHDGKLFSNLPEMPSVSSPVKGAFNTLDGKNKESDVSVNNVPRSSISTLHAPIFKSYQASSEVESMPTSKYLAHQRNESEASAHSSRSKTTINNQHQRDYSQSSLGPSPLGQSRSPSRGSRESSGSKYSDSSSIYSTKSEARSIQNSSHVNADESSIINNKQSATASYNLDRHSNPPSLSDLSESVEVGFDYVVPEMSTMGTIEERIAVEELYAMSNTSSSVYAPSMTSEVMEQDLNAIRQFAENAWEGLDPDNSVQGGSSFMESGTASLASSRGTSINTIKGRPTVALIEGGEDPDYQF